MLSLLLHRTMVSTDSSEAACALCAVLSERVKARATKEHPQPLIMRHGDSLPSLKSVDDPDVVPAAQ